MSSVMPLPRLLSLTMLMLGGLVALKGVDVVTGAPGRHTAALAVPDVVLGEAEAAVDQNQAAANASSAGQSMTAAPPSKPAGAAAGAMAPPPKAGPAGAQTPNSPMSDGERGLLLDLRQRRGELDARETALAAREALLAAAERKLGGRLDELAALQSKLEALETARKGRDDSNWRGLVKTYESMRPRDAALIFNDLDMPVLLQVVDRMKETKAATILAAMQPEKARQVTANLALMRIQANSVGGDH